MILSLAEAIKIIYLKLYNTYNLKISGFCVIIKNEIFNNFYWFIYKNSYFTKNELLLTPNIKDEDATNINMRFNNFMHVCKYSKIRTSRIAKFILRFIEEYNEEKKFDGKESDEQKNIYDLILKKNIDSIFDNETEYNIIINIYL